MLKRVQIKVYDNTTTHYISKIASLLILPMRSDIIIYDYKRYLSLREKRASVEHKKVTLLITLYDNQINK